MQLDPQFSSQLAGFVLMRRQCLRWRQRLPCRRSQHLQRPGGRRHRVRCRLPDRDGRARCDGTDGYDDVGPSPVRIVHQHPELSILQRSFRSTRNFYRSGSDSRASTCTTRRRSATCWHPELYSGWSSRYESISATASVAARPSPPCTSATQEGPGAVVGPFDILVGVECSRRRRARTGTPEEVTMPIDPTGRRTAAANHGTGSPTDSPALGGRRTRWAEDMKDLSGVPIDVGIRSRHGDPGRRRRDRGPRLHA